MKLTLITLTLITLARIASASPIVGESLYETMVRQRFEDQLEDMQREQKSQAYRLEDKMNENAERLDSIRRQLEDQDDSDQ
jgi:TolA-binding protein